MALEGWGGELWPFFKLLNQNVNWQLTFLFTSSHDSGADLELEPIGPAFPLPPLLTNLGIFYEKNTVKMFIGTQMPFPDNFLQDCQSPPPPPLNLLPFNCKAGTIQFQSHLLKQSFEAQSLTFLQVSTCLSEHPVHVSTDHFQIRFSSREQEPEVEALCEKI